MSGVASSTKSSVTLWVLVLAMALVDSAPYRSKSKDKNQPQQVYNQKQTGDYNIHVHLQDFQIIALLRDDPFSEEEYDYDYADFTVKPSSSSSTTPKKTTSSSSTTTPPELSSAVTTNFHPSPLEVVVLNPTKKPATANATEGNSTVSTPTAEEPPAAGQIKVQILEVPIVSDPLGIVPGEDVQSDPSEGVLYDELFNYRKCATGYSRDKNGRCRWVRKPATSAYQLPFKFGRLASKVATKLRLPVPKEPQEPTDLITKR